MKYTGPTFRPPFESESLLLQVTVGCSHNKCTFCTMHSDVCFKTESLEQIERDLLETIAMYASVNNIKDKNDDELKKFRALKINDLNIGIESDSSTVLKLLNKGFTPDEAKKQLRRLTKAGIDYSVNIIIGAAGSDKSLHHAIESSNLLNELNPSLIFVATLHVDPGSPLEIKLKNGDFKENSIEGKIIKLLTQWKAVLLCHMYDAPKRFLELQRITNGISHKVLTENLKELENDKLIEKIVYNENPPKVEYKLTPMVKDLTTSIKEIEKWSKKYLSDLTDDI